MKLTYEELTTVTSEVESVGNSRPLTYIYEDEVEEALTLQKIQQKDGDIKL